MYRLTMPEIQKLLTGFEVWEREKAKEADAQSDAGGSPTHPNRKAPGEIRNADKRAVAEFADDHDLATSD